MMKRVFALVFACFIAIAISFPKESVASQNQPVSPIVLFIAKINARSAEDRIVFQLNDLVDNTQSSLHEESDLHERNRLDYFWQTLLGESIGYHGGYYSGFDDFDEAKKYARSQGWPYRLTDGIEINPLPDNSLIRAKIGGALASVAQRNPKFFSRLLNYSLEGGLYHIPKRHVDNGMMGSYDVYTWPDKYKKQVEAVKAYLLIGFLIKAGNTDIRQLNAAIDQLAQSSQDGQFRAEGYQNGRYKSFFPTYVSLKDYIRGPLVQQKMGIFQGTGPAPAPIIPTNLGDIARVNYEPVGIY